MAPEENIKQIEQILLTLGPLEKTIFPLLKLGSVEDIGKEAKLPEAGVKRALQFLKNKGLVDLSSKKTKIIRLDINGILYLRKGLPERRLISLLVENKVISLGDAKKQSNMSDNEFTAGLGVLKRKNFVEIKTGRLHLSVGKENIALKFPEEKFLEELPLELEELDSGQKSCFDKLIARKSIIELDEESKISFKITELGSKVLNYLPKFKKEIIEQLSSEMLKKGSWKGKIFRRYDLETKAPEIYGGKRHFVNQAADYARKIWLEMGFKEMTGDLIQTTFWNFDALFTAQDHPVREMQDTFYIKDMAAKLPDKKLVRAIRETHGKGIKGSRGWQYDWDEAEAKKVVLRTHTTCLSAKELARLGELKNKTGKFFAMGKCFRNETLDWSHGFEFNQSEGIVIGKDLNMKHLISYLKEFFNKMGFEKIRVRPSFFAFTEPSLEVDVYHSEKKEWLEIGGAGILRPEVVVPLLGENISVLAWGIGFDRMIMDYYSISDIRELYKNDLSKLRDMKFWLK